MNIKTLTDPAKRKDVLNWLRDKKYSIYCLQDIHVGEKNKHLFEKDWGSEVTIQSKSSDSRLVAILLKENLNFKIIEIEKDVGHNNLLLIHLHVCEFNFYLLVIYGPNTDSPDFI